MKRTTIKDVAREAGVSISTVSNALNNSGVISEKTRALVLEVAERLHYIPNRSGQSLRNQEKKAIGLFLHELRGAYYGTLADTLHHECRKRGYELYIFITHDDNTILQKTIGGDVSAAVLFCEVSGRVLQELNHAGIPVVGLNAEISDECISSIAFDSYHAGELAANYLMSLGHKRLMHISGIQNNYDSISREKGMRDAMARQGLALEAEYLLEGQFSRSQAYQEMKRFLAEGKSLPEGIFAANDESAHGCIQALHEEGYNVPEDVSIVGCDDIEMCEIMTPTLTTIRTNFAEQGALALRCLMDMMDGAKGCVHYIDGQLVIRNSCKAKV